MRAGPHCSSLRAQLVPHPGLGSPPCPYCRLLHLDPGGSWQVHADCEPMATIHTRAWFVLPPTLETYYRRRHADYHPPPPFRPDCRAALDPAGSAALSLVYPRENGQIYVPVEMDGAL